DEWENRGSKSIKTGVVPVGLYPAGVLFFAQINQPKILVQVNGAAFGSVLQILDRDQHFLVTQVPEFSVHLWLYQDIAVNEQKGMVAGERLGQADDSAGAVLSHFLYQFNVQSELLPLAQIILDRFFPVADDDQDLFDTSRG